MRRRCGGRKGRVLRKGRVSLLVASRLLGRRLVISPSLSSGPWTRAHADHIRQTRWTGRNPSLSARKIGAWKVRILLLHNLSSSSLLLAHLHTPCRAQAWEGLRVINCRRWFRADLLPRVWPRDLKLSESMPGSRRRGSSTPKVTTLLCRWRVKRGEGAWVLKGELLRRGICGAQHALTIPLLRIARDVVLRRDFVGCHGRIMAEDAGLSGKTRAAEPIFADG